MTISEDLFSEFCAETGIPIQRIEEGTERRPDFVIEPHGQKVVVEIKQFEPSPEEEDQYRKFLGGESVVVDMSPPGRKVRTAVQSGYPQLKALAGDDFPAVLLLYNNVFIADHTDSYAIKTGMFGVEVIDFAVPADFQHSPYEVDRRFGGRRRVTPDQRRSLSAIAVLFRGRDGMMVHVFHNPYAVGPEKALGRNGRRQSPSGTVWCCRVGSGGL